MSIFLCAYEHGRGILYTIQDFNEAHFPQDWFRIHGRFGDGCEIDFPICMCSSIKWSPTVYTCSGSQKPKHYLEVCTLWMLKKRC